MNKVGIDNLSCGFFRDLEIVLLCQPRFGIVKLLIYLILIAVSAEKSSRIVGSLS